MGSHLRYDIRRQYRGADLLYLFLVQMFFLKKRIPQIPQFFHSYRILINYYHSFRPSFMV